MQNRSPQADDLDCLGEKLLRVIHEQKDTLDSGRLDDLPGLTQQRKQAFELLVAAIEATRTAGGPVPTPRLVEIVQEIAAIDETCKTTIDDCLRQNALLMRQIQQGRQVLNYQRRPGHIRTSTVDLKR
jgi:hypothetical protein